MFKIRQNLSVCSHTFKFEPAERQRLKDLKQNIRGIITNLA